MKTPLLAAIPLALLLCSLTARGGETLYNGIQLPDEWPPRPAQFAGEQPVKPPYLVQPPAIIPIDTGRQLLVDDFLIQETTLKRVFHQPVYHPGNPILKADRVNHPWANWRDKPSAAPFSDGVWFDPRDSKFKMWYMAGTTAMFGYAESKDGVHWERPQLDGTRYKGTNRLTIDPSSRDSSTVWLDLNEPDPARRFKMLYYRAGLQQRVSADGIQWSDLLPGPGPSGDRTTFFYNPFRERWIFSVRAGRNPVGRCRYYHESRQFGVPLWKNVEELSRWACSDALDRMPGQNYEPRMPDLYNLDATPYESLMLGLFTIHSKVAEGPRPKFNQVMLGFSRDGFHWDRPDRRPFLAVSEDPKAWNYGNVQSAGGGCLVVGDQLYFYFSGRNSYLPEDDGSGGATGLAMLRRDGFASMEAQGDGGMLLTRPLRFEGKHLFVNSACSDGELRAEVLDESGAVIPPYTLENSVPVKVDSTAVALNWKGATDLGKVANRPARLRFTLDRGALFAFWVSPDPGGASRGYVAAGGPGFPGHRDVK